MSDFKFGTCTTPAGKAGKWQIDEFTITPFEARCFNVDLAMSFSHPMMHIRAGKYKRLTFIDAKDGKRKVMMSNTPMEVSTNREAYDAATGDVLINGLGMGMLLEAILHKPGVRSVRVIEREQEVIDLVGPHFTDPRVQIIKADAMEYRPNKGEHFNYAWHDIWPRITDENLPEMAILGRRYNKRVADAQGHWCRNFIRSYYR